MDLLSGLLATLAGFLLLLGVPAAYVAAQVRALRRWRGPIRAAAALPLPVWLVWCAKFGVDVARDPTSHNLFPFEILFLALGSLAWLGLVAVVGRLLGAARPDRNPRP
jgi:hypothetical protein